MAAVESWEDTPTFLDLATGISSYLQTSYHEVFVETRSSIKMDSWNITTCDVTCVAVLTAALSIFCYILKKHVSMPIAVHYNLPVPSRKKVPESAWRFIYFLFAWCYTWYVVILSGKYKFFQKPETMWNGWSLETLPPADIYSIYVIHVSFYLHWTYATLFVDIWRKDSVAMVIHHIMTLGLIFLSYATRCHNIGVLMLFLHDMTEISLELSKLYSYFSVHVLETKKWIQRMAVVGFVSFIATWIVSRLYWYPLKVVYSAVIHTQRLEQKIPYLFLMNHLALLQLILNIYWFVWILITFHRIVNGRLEDPREINMEGMLPEQLSSDKNRSSHILKKKY